MRSVTELNRKLHIDQYEVAVTMNCLLVNMNCLSYELFTGQYALFTVCTVNWSI